MNSGFYSACSGLVARMQQLDTVAHNLANANTAGYRGELVDFHTVLADQSPMAVTTASGLNEFGTLGDTRLDLAQGTLQHTGNNLDVGIEGPGFLAVQTNSGVRYTRNGSFRVSPTGMLQTQTGDAVLGDSGPVRLPDGSFTISGDGTISSNGALAGKLRIVEFSAETPLTSLGNGLYDAPKGAALAARSSTLRQGMLEDSNVNPVQAAVGLVALQRNAEMLNRVMSMFHGELNKTATEDLPRV